MYSAEFLNAAGGVEERILLTRAANAIEADDQAKKLFDGARTRQPEVVGFVILQDDMTVAGFGLEHV
jgi:hypothetical protein